MLFWTSWELNTRNTKIFIQGNAFENVTCNVHFVLWVPTKVMTHPLLIIIICVFSFQLSKQLKTSKWWSSQLWTAFILAHPTCHWLFPRTSPHASCVSMATLLFGGWGSSWSTPSNHKRRWGMICRRLRRGSALKALLLGKLECEEKRGNDQLWASSVWIRKGQSKSV